MDGLEFKIEFRMDVRGGGQGQIWTILNMFNDFGKIVQFGKIGQLDARQEIHSSRDRIEVPGLWALGNRKQKCVESCCFDLLICLGSNIMWEIL